MDKLNDTVVSNPSKEKQRLDSWLWASRFYKSRKLASESIVGGHVKINGQRCKPGRFVSIGEKISIVKNGVAFDIVVLGLSRYRLPARLATNMYDESEQSRLAREQTQATQKRNNAGLVYDNKHPDKRQRKQLIRIKQTPFD